MLRLYLTNESYPELRGVRRGLPRSRTWWRAMAHATRHAGIWLFAVTQVLIVVGFAAADRAVLLLVDEPRIQVIAHVSFGVAALIVFGYLQTSWGGDIMRSHLRAVSDIARYACPNCGQSLYGHLDEESATVRCPECGARIQRAIFEPPHRTPPEFRAFFRRRG
ncbi:MAG: hypothetical protein IID28_07655 [Planctomycetes bacterium]|nr:hypothetical protein [Planctomycetota bacterium]